MIHFTFAILVPNYFRDFFMKNILFLLAWLSILTSASAQFESQSSETSIYIISCSPGYDLYSVFGHSAILVKTPTTDWVYNYGTFNFDTDNFYVKFAKGQLPYRLAKEQFGYFQYGYIHEQRSIMAQELNMTDAEKYRLVELLEKNALPENAEYKYDFFYDNCATRVMDIVDEATGNSINWNQNPNGNGLSFRDMIQVYLNDMEWGDLGIDIALGLPCDKILEKNQQAFLPDSLMTMFSEATLRGNSLVGNEIEVLPAEEQTIIKRFEDSTFKVIGLICSILFVLILVFRKTKLGRGLSMVVLIINGVLGLLFFTLWFFTDHNATANNLNILWANPLNLVLPFLKRARLPWLRIFSLLILALLATWIFLPQDMHESLLPFIGLSLLSALVYGRILKA